MGRSRKGFTLIEMLIVIAIVGILAAVAIPAFQMYAIQARLTEVTNGMSNVASAVASYYQDAQSNGEAGTWPVCGSLAAIQTTLGVSLAALRRIQAISIDENGVITVIVTNINASVDGKSLTLTPTLAADSSINWAWGTSSDFPTYLVPKR